MTPEAARQIEELTVVNWVGLFHPAYKLNPNLDYSIRKMYTVRVEDGIDVDSVADEIRSMGVNVIGSSENILTVLTDEDQIAPLAQVLDVAWIDAFAFKENTTNMAPA